MILCVVENVHSNIKQTLVELYNRDHCDRNNKRPSSSH
jgi:hypothetical protein